MASRNTFRSALAWLVQAAFVAVAAMSLAALLVFPAFKGVWLGYVPVLLGALLAAWLGKAALSDRSDTSDGSDRPGRSEILFLGLLLVVPVLIQAALILVLRPAPLADGRFVLDQAAEFARIGTMPAFTYYPPAQIWWYAAFFKAFGASDLVAQLSHLPLMAVLVWVTYRIGLMVTDRARARLAAVLTAMYPSMLLYVLVTPYYFYLYTALTLLAALAWLASLRESRWWLAAAAGGVAAAGSALSKAVMLMAPVQALVFYGACRAETLDKNLWRRWLVFCAAFALTLAPWVVRNAKVFGEPVLVCTSGGLVLSSANNPESNGLYSPLPDEVKVDSPRAFLDHSRACSRQAVEFMVSRPAAFLRLVILKNLHTWGNETTYTELINRRGKSPGRIEDALSLLIQTGWAALVFLWVWRLLNDLRKGTAPDAMGILCAVAVISNALVYSVYEGGARHHLPLVPLLILYVFRQGSSDARHEERNES